MDATLSTLKACRQAQDKQQQQHCQLGVKLTDTPEHSCCCRHLALSTNNIEKISSLSGMDNLRILSLGRNLLKKIENVEVVADTLEELWLSYNQIEKLVRLVWHDSQQQIGRDPCQHALCSACSQS